MGGAANTRFRTFRNSEKYRDPAVRPDSGPGPMRPPLSSVRMRTESSDGCDRAESGKEPAAGFRPVRAGAESGHHPPPYRDERFRPVRTGTGQEHRACTNTEK